MIHLWAKQYKWHNTSGNMRQEITCSTSLGLCLSNKRALRFCICWDVHCETYGSTRMSGIPAGQGHNLTQQSEPLFSMFRLQLVPKEQLWWTNEGPKSCCWLKHDRCVGKLSMHTGNCWSSSDSTLPKQRYFCEDSKHQLPCVIKRDTSIHDKRNKTKWV